MPKITVLYNYLHSNMDRLKAVAGSEQAVLVAYLHSNMDRLKVIHLPPLSPLFNQFTFQYG